MNLFETSLPLRLDYEACLAYLALPPAGGVFLLVMEHKSDYVRYVLQAAWVVCPHGAGVSGCLGAFGLTGCEQISCVAIESIVLRNFRPSPYILVVEHLVVDAVRVRSRSDRTFNDARLS